jgi:hypothetical protein
VVDVINAPELTRSIKTSVNTSNTGFIGYINELTITDQEDPEDFKNRYQPPEWAPLEDQVKKEFADVVREDLPPGLPPKRFLRRTPARACHPIEARLRANCQATLQVDPRRTRSSCNIRTNNSILKAMLNIGQVVSINLGEMFRVSLVTACFSLYD